ncbi:MAG: zinc ribbon domain-containing protein, partial [Alphaproteobacteria bacterium]|nr:zinc ribbon domain-containing protein [Alphaproteobacteria bacterium]
MTTPLPPPRKKDPVARTRAPTQPPGNRSREAQGLTAMAAVGRFALQCCADCGQVQYPPRQICGQCLGDDLPWRDVDPSGTLLAETKLHHANDLFFRDRVPWRLGVVGMDAGPSVVAHLAEDCRQGDRVNLSLNLDRSGHAVMNARPETPGPNQEDDMQLRELSMDPKGRRVLIVNGKTALGLALARSFKAAGSREIFVGQAEPWKAAPAFEAIKALDGVTTFPL